MLNKTFYITMFGIPHFVQHNVEDTYCEWSLNPYDMRYFEDNKRYINGYVAIADCIFELPVMFDDKKLVLHEYNAS